MNKPIVLFYKLSTLYEILSEINNLFNFDIYNILQESDLANFLKERKNHFLIISETKINQIPNNQNIIVSNFPVKISNLLENINILLLKRKFVSQSEININDYRLDLNARILKLGKKRLKLTQKEAEVLLFIRNSNKDVSISSLRKKVWRYSSELETHTVETHVYRLRKKIKDAFNDDSFIKSKDNGYKI